MLSPNAARRSRRPRFLSVLAGLALCANAPVEQLGEGDLPFCGTQYAPPFGDRSDATERPCAGGAHVYAARHRGLGYQVLDLESEACFVPDAAYRLLDEIVDEALARARQTAPASVETAQNKALRISAIVGDVLQQKGFGLYIPTATLADALVNRAALGQPPRYIFDCDTGAIILLTVAENLGMPAALVEITLPSGSGHNYVRWQTGADTVLDWDTNGRGPCRTPSNLPPFEGRAMARDETLSYVITLRAGVWKRRGDLERAAQDFERAIQMAPLRPLAMNNFAWMVATKAFPSRERYRQEALGDATKAVELQRIPNYLDTLACAQAYAGAFKAAATTERAALTAQPGEAGFAARLSGFTASPPRDCTGAE
jgi:tetratricopeptide (TPR) repeat protein